MDDYRHKRTKPLPPPAALASTPRAEPTGGGAKPKTLAECVAGLGRIVSDSNDGAMAVLVDGHPQGIVWFRMHDGVLESMNEATRAWEKWSQ